MSISDGWVDNSNPFDASDLDKRLVRGDQCIKTSARFQSNCQLEPIEGSESFCVSVFDYEPLGCRLM